MASDLTISVTPPLLSVPSVEFPTERARVEQVCCPQINEQSLQTYKDPKFRATLFGLLCEETTTRLLFKIEYLKSQFEAVLKGSTAEVNARFPDLPCPRNTAVKVNALYLHANYVRDKDAKRIFVASQLPTDPALFWRFVLNEGYNILDLYNQESFYYPSSEGTPLVLSNIEVKLIETFGQTTDEYSHTYLVHDLSTDQKEIITRCHFTGWPTHAVVDVPILDYLVNKLETPLSGNTLVHCLAGYGRTGTVLAAFLLKQRLLKKPSLDLADLGPLLQDLLVHLRGQRGLHFVESKEQYFLLLDYGIFILRQRENPLT